MITNQINETLLRILKDNADTDCGRKWNFGNIKTIGAFQAEVPLTTYDDYAPLIELTTRIGEKDIFTALPLAGYALTSGTTGVPKLIPCTQKHLAQYVEAFEHMSVKGSTLLLFESMPRTFKYADQAALDAISGMVLVQEQKKISDVSYKRLIARGTYTSPKELMITKEVMDTVHLRLLFALVDKKLEQIIAPFTWGIVELFNYLEYHWETLTEEIASGKISESVKISPELAAKIESKFAKNPKRAEELRVIFSQGFSEPVAGKIWPRLRRVIAAGSGSFEIYTEKLTRYIGEIEHINGLYAASEALLGTCDEAGSDVYTFCEEQVFCEFIPVDCADADKVLLSRQLEPGKAYQVVVTNNSGFYRYRLGDVIRVQEIVDEKVRFTYEYRINQTHSFVDEEINEKDILTVVKQAEKKYSISINDYCYWADYDNDSYTIFMEPGQYDDMIKRIDKIDRNELEGYCDEVLSGLNERYANLRKDRKLAGCKVMFLQPQTHLLYRDILRYRRKTAQDQIKPVRYLDNPVKEKFFFSMLDGDLHTMEQINYYTDRFSKSKKERL